MYVLGYEYLTLKQQEAARSLPKVIYVDSIMTKMTERRLLQSATTRNKDSKALASLATTHIVGTA
jgi:hypothetical protein